MENVKNNNGQNGQQVRVDAPKQQGKKFLNMTTKQWIVTSACTFGGAALIYGGIKLYRYYKAKKAAAQEAAPANEPTK